MVGPFLCLYIKFENVVQYLLHPTDAVNTMSAMSLVMCLLFFFPMETDYVYVSCFLWSEHLNFSRCVPSQLPTCNYS